MQMLAELLRLLVSSALKFSMENFRKNSALQVAKKCYKDTLKASLKDFSIPTYSWEQTAQDRTKQHCLIK